MAIGVPETGMDWDRRDADVRDNDVGPSVGEHVDELCAEIRERARRVVEGLATDHISRSDLRAREAALRDAFKELCNDLGVSLRDDNGRPLL